MSLKELFLFAKQVEVSAVDLTAYYIRGYPMVPEDEELYEIKKMAFGMGIVQNHQYQGYFPLETLGERDPEKKVKKLYKTVTGSIG